MVTEATAEIRALLIRDGCSEETADRVLAFADDIREQVAVQVEEQLESRDGKIDALASSIDEMRGEMRSGFTEVDEKFIMIREQLAEARVEGAQQRTQLWEKITNVRVEHEQNIREVDQRITKVREELADMRVEHERSIGKVRLENANLRTDAVNGSKPMNARISRFGRAAMVLIATTMSAIIGAVAAFG